MEEEQAQPCPPGASSPTRGKGKAFNVPMSEEVHDEATWGGRGASVQKRASKGRLDAPAPPFRPLSQWPVPEAGVNGAGTSHRT